MRISGTIPSLIIGIFPRFMIMSYIDNPLYVLAIQPLHALGIGLVWAAIVEHTYKIVPEHIKMTAITLMSSIEFIATAAVVNMVGGLVYDYYGGRLLFRYSAIIAVIWSLFMVLLFWNETPLRKTQL